MSLAYASHRVVVYDVCICSGMEKKNIKKRRRNPKAKLIYVLAVNIITTSLISNGHSKFLSVVNVWQWTLMKKWQNIGIWNKFGDMALHPKTSPECFYPLPNMGGWELELWNHIIKNMRCCEGLWIGGMLFLSIMK